ncbi:MAG: hypothetical protein KDA31_01165 [Phycisphaerales bacterium]|nr:hypothetical protein [Phycisphaerales bacterium]
MDAQHAAWNDATEDWSAFDLCVIRSTWDYYLDADQFLQWIELAESRTHLENHPEIVRWNIHKRYLTQLESAGLPIVPTVFIDRENELPLEALLDGKGWDDIVIKPAISAGSNETFRFGADAFLQADAFLLRHTPHRDMMIQPYLKSVESGGERSTIFINGSCSHVIEKKPRFQGDDESVSGELPVTDEERDMLGRALELLPEPVMYARLDTMRDGDGSRLISELELIEPSLFLLQSETAQKAFVDAVKNAISR